MNLIYKLRDEVPLIKELKTDTISLIRSTEVIDAIKRLVLAHDILALSLKISEDFRRVDWWLSEPTIDRAALKDLATIRRELFIYHRLDFSPQKYLDLYYNKLGSLFMVLQFNLETPKDEVP